MYTPTKDEQKEISKGRAEMLSCANCGKITYFGAMNLIALEIMCKKPVCSYECNKALGQVI